jgi:hypothetical protein
MTHDERVWHHTYETLEGIAEHAERIASLEELVLEMRPFLRCMAFDGCDTLAANVRESMRKLGLEDK